jgi:zinc protease
VFALPIIALVAAAQADVFPYEPHDKTWENGLRATVIPMPEGTPAAISVWMAVGSRDEVDEGRTGFAHFFEHLMFYGTEALDRAARERALHAMGAEDNAWTWFDDTVYHAVVGPAHVERLLSIEADRFQNLTLTEEMVRREAGAVFGEYRGGLSDPAERLIDTLYAEAFPNHTYGHPTIGIEADIAAMPTAHAYAAEFFERTYRPERTHIIVAGDVDPEQVLGWIDAAWGKWTKPPFIEPEASQDEPQPPAVDEEAAATEPTRAAVAWAGNTSPRLALGWRIGGSSLDLDAASLQVLAKVLGEPTGPLVRRLVDRERLAVRVDVTRDDLVDPGLFHIEVVGRQGASLEAIEAAVYEELGRIAAGLDPVMLDATLSHMRYEAITALDKPARVASRVGWSMRRHGDPAALDTWYGLLATVTPASVSAAMATHLNDASLVVVTLSSTVTPDDVTPDDVTHPSEATP